MYSMCRPTAKIELNCAVGTELPCNTPVFPLFSTVKKRSLTQYMFALIFAAFLGCVDVPANFQANALMSAAVASSF